jgi:hypothetical protein
LYFFEFEDSYRHVCMLFRLCLIAIYFTAILDVEV